MGSRLVFTDDFRERAPPVTCQVLFNAQTGQVETTEIQMSGNATYQDLDHPGIADCYVGSHLEDE